MSRALLELKAELNQAHEDSLYEAWRTVQQAAAREQSRGCKRILESLATVIDSAYTELEDQ